MPSAHLVLLPSQPACDGIAHVAVDVLAGRVAFVREQFEARLSTVFLPRLRARRQQYAYYRDKLLSFPRQVA